MTRIGPQLVVAIVTKTVAPCRPIHDVMEWLKDYHVTCVSKVEPHRPVMNKKISSPLGSPITSAKRWNVDSGTTIIRRQNWIWAWYINELYWPRHSCMPVGHNMIVWLYAVCIFIFIHDTTGKNRKNSILCAQLTRDLFAIAKFLLHLYQIGVLGTQLWRQCVHVFRLFLLLKLMTVGGW